METAEPFKSFVPKDFIKRRYSPLVASFIDSETDKIIRQCGFTFMDIISSLGMTLPNPIRIVHAEKVNPMKQEDFLNRVSADTTLFGKSFLSPDFEENFVTNPEFSPIYGAIKKQMFYPSLESGNPPWYKNYLEKLCGSLRYSEFDFFDLPMCILYITASGTPAMSGEELRRLLNFPEWMREFLNTVPIVKVVVYDSLLTSEPPKELTSSKGTFEKVVGLPFRTRRQNAPGGPDMVMLRNLFRYDGNILENPNLGNYMTDLDIKNAKNVVEKIEESVTEYIRRTISSRTFEIDESKKFSNSVKSWFNSRNAPEKTTKVGGIPWKKVLYSHLAALYLITGKYPEAQKLYKQYAASITEPQFVMYRHSALFISSILNAVISNQHSQLEQSIAELLSTIKTTNNLRFVLYVPAVAIEFHASTGDEVNAFKLCRKNLERTRQSWSGNGTSKNLALALFTERLAGLTRDDNRAFFTTYKALRLYKIAEQPAHALRCAIWLMAALPSDSWHLMRQTVWLEKATLLCTLMQGARSLSACKDLLALPNLSPSLHERTISQFFAPYNDPTMSKEALSVRINSLLEVRGVRLVDPSVPEYWGLDGDDFSKIEEEYDAWHSLKMDRSVTKTFASWNEEGASKKAAKLVGCGQPISITLSLFNRYKFSVHLDHAVLVADYQGDAAGERTYDMDTIKNVNILGWTSKCSDLRFDFTPLQPGTFTISKFQKNYWGYVDTEVDCGPIAFKCVRGFPKLKIALEGLTETALAWQCVRFAVVVENTGEEAIDSFDIVFDKPRSIVSDTAAADTELLDEAAIHHVNAKLEAGETKRVPMVLRATRLDDLTLRFIVAVNGIKCGFARATVRVSSPASVDAYARPRNNESMGVALYTTITPHVDGISIHGFMNRDGKIIKTLPIAPLGKVGVPVSIVAFPSEVTDDEEEKWRTSIMGTAPIALLFRIGNDELLSQKNINFEVRNNTMKASIHVPGSSTIKRGEVIRAIVEISEIEDQEEVIVEPLPIALAGRNGPARARWRGLTKRTLTATSGYKAEFEIIAFGSGMFNIPGISISRNNATETMYISQDFHVIVQ